MQKESDVDPWDWRDVDDDVVEGIERVVEQILVERGDGCKPILREVLECHGLDADEVLQWFDDEPPVSKQVLGDMSSTK
jgi:hypothetical protein